MTAADPAARALLALASVAVAFAAADTYVVVLALPDMMASAGLPIDALQRAAPIVSGFLLGYVAMLPLIGRMADLRGRLPVLVMALVVFSLGSLLTALSFDLPSMVVGRFFQGVGGGGLVPATLALVADLYPVQRRAVPLGIVSAVQELGSVIGPLFGALVLAVADWPAIFLINLAVGLLLAAGVRVLAAAGGRQARATGRFDYLGLGLALVAVGAGCVTLIQPDALMRDLTWGQLFIPFVGSGHWPTPIGAVAATATVLLLARCLTARRPLIQVGEWLRSMLDADLIGALLLACCLGGIVLAFATADPKVDVIAPQGRWYLLGSVVAAAALWWHFRRAASPLVPAGAISRAPAWGSLVVSFFVGAALIAALIDIPLFARTTVSPDSQVDAALVLVRFLVALPVGAVIGGYATRILPAGVVTAAGMAGAATGFVLMSRWDLTSLEHSSSTLPLVVGGFGFGLALAPVNAAVLATTDHAVHGLTTALVVVARMVGMLVGISALTTLGLRSYWAELGGVPDVREVCDGASRCAEFTLLLRQAGIAQEHTVFLGAAVCAAIAGGLALLLFRTADTRGLDTGELLFAAG